MHVDQSALSISMGSGGHDTDLRPLEKEPATIYTSQNWLENSLTLSSSWPLGCVQINVYLECSPTILYLPTYSHYSGSARISHPISALTSYDLRSHLLDPYQVCAKDDILQYLSWDV